MFDGYGGYGEDSQLQDVEPHDLDFRTSLGGGQLSKSTDTVNRSDTVKVQLIAPQYFSQVTKFRQTG